MRILCDTQIILWLMLSDDRLKSSTEALLASRDNEVLFSSASLFEIAVKTRAGKFDVGIEPLHENCVRAGMTLLPMKVSLLGALSRLKNVPHNDPFDHLLIAQAMAEGVPLLTADRIVQRYPIEIIKA